MTADARPTVVSQGHKEKKVRHVVESKLPELRHHYLESGQPYSKSHMRRLKRKAKEELAGGGLASLAAQLSEDAPQESAEPQHTQSRRNKPKSAPAADGKIGQGKGKTLKEDQRRKQIATNRTHLQAVLQNPAFKANPFAAIRLHAANSLALEGGN